MVITLVWSATLLRLIFNDRAAEIELLQTAGEKWSFYLEPLVFHKVVALVDSPRLLVRYDERRLWAAEDFSLFSRCSDMKKRNALGPFWALTHESLMNYRCRSGATAQAHLSWTSFHEGNGCIFWPFTTSVLLCFVSHAGCPLGPCLMSFVSCKIDCDVLHRCLCRSEVMTVKRQNSFFFTEYYRKET